MAFDFDLEAAINAIATLEAAITTPTPGVTNAYTYGANPVEISDLSALPAVVHIPEGVSTAVDGEQGTITRATYQMVYNIRSIMLVLQAVPDQYPADETASGLFWKSLTETFFNYDNRVTLTSSANAHSYYCTFPARSYDIRAYPPLSGDYKLYWSYEYTHSFIFAGG